MGAHSRPRKGFNKTMAVAIAAGVAVSGGVQIAAPADSILASSANAATFDQGQSGAVLPTTFEDTFEVQTSFRDAGDNYVMDVHVFFPDVQKYGKKLPGGELYRRGYSEFYAYPGKYYPEKATQPKTVFYDWSKYVNNRGDWKVSELHPIDAATGRASEKYGVSNDPKLFGFADKSPLISAPNMSTMLPSGEVGPHMGMGAPGSIGERQSEGGGLDFNGGNPAGIFLVGGTNDPVVHFQSGVRYGFQIENYAKIPKAYLDANGMKPSDFLLSAHGFSTEGGNGISDGSYKFKATYADVKTDADNNNPTGKKVTVEQNAKVPAAKTGISNYAELKNVKDATWKTTPSTAKVGPSKQTVVVEYNDGSKDEVVVDFEVTKSTTQADTNNPAGKKVTVEQNAAVPDAKTGISNTGDLKNVKSYTWKNKPSTANVGSTKQVVVVEYNDGSKDEVTVDFEVTKSTTNADDYQPAPVPQSVKYGDPAVTDANKLFSNWAKMPKGTTATPVNPPKEITKPVDVTYTITYPDKSSEQVKVKHTPGKMSDAFDPKGKDVKTELNGKPVAKTGIANVGDMPSGTTYTWKTAPKTDARGKFPATVVVKYSDNSTDEVPVNVIVEATDAAVFDPQPKPITVKSFDTPKPETGILNPGKLPKGTAFTWKEAPNTSKPGKVNGVVTVKYPDGSTDDVSVPVTVTPIADEYDPKPKPLTVNNGDKPGAADGIANKNDLPKDATYKWEKAPDTSKPGTTNPVAIVTYKDGSTDRVTVPVTVRAMAEVYNPIPQDVTVNRTQKPNAADAIKNKKDLPEGTKYDWKSPVDTSTGGKKPAVVVVTYPDGSREEVSTNVIVRPDNEVYTPTAKPLTVNNGDKPNPADGIGNKNELPEGTKYTWEKAPDTSKPGKTEGVVTVTYPDGTKDRVTVPVTVRTQAEQFDPKPKPIESWTGENPPAIDGILNPDKLPKGTKFDWEKKPDTSKPGDTTGVVKVTYPDGSTDRVTVPVRVFLSGDDYQKILDDIAAHEKAIDDLNKEIDRINGEIGKLKGDVNTLKNQMKKAQQDIADLQDQVKKHQAEIDRLKGRMDAAEKRLDGHDKDIADLKKRVAALEKRMADAERRLDNIDKQIKQIMAELERLDGNEIVEGIRNADNSITLVKKDGRTVEIAPATKYGLEKCTAQLGGGLMALVPTLIVLSQAGNAVNLPGFEQQMVALQKQVGVYNPQIADFVAKNGPALAAGAVGLAVIGSMFIPGTCGSDSIANALGESLRGNPNAANPDVRETHDFKGPRFVPKPGTEGETATAGSSLSIGKDAKPTTPADESKAPATDKGADSVPETAAGATAPAPTPVIDNDTADVLEDLAALAELDNDTEDFDLAVADAFATK